MKDIDKLYYGKLLNENWPKIAEKAKKRAIYVRFRPYLLNGLRYGKTKSIDYI